MHFIEDYRTFVQVHNERVFVYDSELTKHEPILSSAYIVQKVDKKFAKKFAAR